MLITDLQLKEVERIVHFLMWEVDLSRNEFEKVFVYIRLTF